MNRIRRARTAVIDWLMDEIVLSTNKAVAVAAAVGVVALLTREPISHQVGTSLTIIALGAADAGAWVGRRITLADAEDAE